MSPEDKRAEIEEILVDCYDEEEQMSAWEVAFQDEVAVPFPATLLGTPVEVRAFQLGEHGNIQCLVTTADKQRWVGVEDLDEIGLPADFLHILDLYDSWCSGDY